MRTEASAEAALVAARCAVLGLPHATLRWHWDGRGNVMDRARQGRLALLDRWRGDIRHVLMAHTADDLAETFLMRLARGAGVDGLSAMQDSRSVSLAAQPRVAAAEFSGELPPETAPRSPALRVLRPLLDVSRDALRRHLDARGLRWAEDPTNTDPAYGRARMRAVLPALAAAGLDSAALADAAHRMARAQQALAVRALAVWQDIGHEDAATGVLRLHRAGLAGIERDTQMRLLSAALCHVSGQDYPPREAPLEALLDAVLSGDGGTLHGCEALGAGDAVLIFRELAAVQGLRSPVTAGALWDGRWRVARMPHGVGMEMRALGHDGWVQAGPDKPPGALPYRVALSAPALWRGDALLACPAIGLGPRDALTRAPRGRPQGFCDVLREKTRASSQDRA